MLLNTLAEIHWNMNPMIFQVGSFGLRWYSLGFLLAFVCGYYMFVRFFKNEKVDTKYLDSLVIYIFLAVLIGARLGHCLFYDFGYYFSKAHWMEIILPFNKGPQGWYFTGYQGLASHGAAIAILIALWLYKVRYKMNPWWLVDRLVIVIALGGAFVRMGNFFNSEIYGVETTLPWGVVFEQRGETVPKHPTQLYESISYFLIFCVCLFFYIKKKGHLRTGLLFGWWLIALFGMRFLIEFVKSNGIIADHSLKMGQVLSIPFILFGVVLVVLAYKNKLPRHIFLTPDHQPLPDKKGKGKQQQ
ncbi:MAG: prolipoprotein diacylglyceryl transferase [Bacteroidales bacterium]|nr:prolipoprotein diacylglyceryl transferase [Bacteroidales bacterium]